MLPFGVASALPAPWQDALNRQSKGTLAIFGACATVGVLACRAFFLQVAATRKPTRRLIKDVSDISVVIPALNEEQGLPTTLAAVLSQSPAPREVIVVDAGSADRTSEVAKAAGATKVLTSQRGRAWQMNAGAKIATGGILLFLHADTEMRPGCLEALEAAMENPRKLGGCFCLRFHEAADNFCLRFSGWCTTTSFLQRPRWTLGDRAIFVRKAAFDALGGYAEIPLMEDPDFALRLSKYGGGPSCFAFLQEIVVTSGRRFLEKGPWRQQGRNLYIQLLWHLGWTPEQLRDMYRYKPPAAK